GGCAALWQTLRDLRDGLVDPQNALEASREGSLARKDGARTEQLLRLLHGLLSFCDSHDVHHHSDVDQFAARHAPSSPFLKQFERIFYYGFYDLTQIQLDGFRTIASHYPTTLLFPLLPIRPSHSGWTFAQRFYERHVQGYSTEPARDLFDLPRPSLPPTLRLFDEQADRVYGSLPVKWHCTVSNSFGIHDEVAAAAKEILRLVDDEGMGFGEIAVITRSLDPYGDAIAEIFREHQVPIRGSVGTPLVQFPLTQAVILLFSLPAKDFLRSHVIDLLSSPYFKLEKSTGADPPRPDLWDLASRELAICKGVHEWRRLRNYAHRDLIISQRSGNDESRVLRVAAAQMRSLADRVESLAADLHALPEKCSWSGYTALYKDLLRKYLGITIDESSGEKNSDPVLKHQILGLLDQMAGLDCVSARVTLVDFSQTFEHWLERSSLDLSVGDVEGVTILSATAARGLSFRALFILGLNEGVFPRTIREDAFLRDRDREALERHLGYKINPKLAGFDEEKLVFILLVGAARERLYISFQRADENGRALLPSWYLGELKHALGAQPERHLTELTIPRSLKEKAGFPPFHREDWLLPEELGIRLTLENRDPGPLIVRFGAAPQVYKRGRLFVAELEGSDKLRPFDGAVGRLASYWRRFVRRGISPTALEIYARCPYQFYARQVLGLERLEQPEKISGPSPADYG
ncbi:MAG TPA: hypothetical protein VE131_05735, partial [Terriglobales bacterium]|nr:hypothetical protein [Terriglobales bacterium]